MAKNTALKWAAGVGTGILVVAGYNKLKKFNTAGNLIFDITKVNIVGLNKLYIYLKVSNPSEETVSFDFINTELYFNNINIGRLYYNKPVFIAQRADQTFVFPVILYPAGQLQLINNMLKNKPKEGIFKIEGSVSVNGVKVPLKKEIKSW